MVIERARVAFIDTIGVAVAGSHEEVSHIVAEMVKAEGSAPQCTVIGQSLRASPQLAALANGVANHAMDYDFTFLNGQSVAAVIPALLPLAETTKATPADVLGAFIVGCEVAARINRSSLRMGNDGGWHITGIVGVIATAAACCKLMKLPVEQVAEAIGMGVSLSSGIAVNYGTMTKPLHCGNAARNGVMAAMLAGKGFTSHAAAFEGNNGFYASFGRALPTDFAPFGDLGKRWDLVEIGYQTKYYPCGGRGHTAIEAALMLRDKIGSRLGEIGNIHCLVSPSSAKRINTNYPPDVEAAKFSAAYVDRLFAGPRHPEDQGVHAGGAQGRAHAGDGETGDRRRRSEARRRLRREPVDPEDHAQGRADVRAAARLRDRVGEDPADAGAARGEVHGLRDADRERRRSRRSCSRS